MGVLREQSTLFMGDSPADNPSPWLETKKDGTTKDICGQNFRGWSPKLSLVGWLLKTYLEYSNLPQMTFARVWSVSATPSGYGILKLRLSERRTAEQESFLWRTPDAGCVRGAQSPERFAESMDKGRLLTLNDQVAHLPALIPTPRSADGAKGQRTTEGAMKEAIRGHGIDLPMFAQLCPTPTVNGNYNKAGVSAKAVNGLATMVKMLPTPTANDSKNNNPPSQRKENGRHSNQLNVVAGGSLNPAWVEWLMGFPIGWTDIGV